MSSQRSLSELCFDVEILTWLRHSQDATSISQQSLLMSQDLLSTQNPIIQSPSCTIRDATIINHPQERPSSYQNITANVQKRKRHDGRQGNLNISRSKRRKN